MPCCSFNGSRQLAPALRDFASTTIKLGVLFGILTRFGEAFRGEPPSFQWQNKPSQWFTSKVCDQKSSGACTWEAVELEATHKLATQLFWLYKLIVSQALGTRVGSIPPAALQCYKLGPNKVVIVCMRLCPMSSDV